MIDNVPSAYYITETHKTILSNTVHSFLVPIEYGVLQALNVWTFSKSNILWLGNRYVVLETERSLEGIGIQTHKVSKNIFVTLKLYKE